MPACQSSVSIISGLGLSRNMILMAKWKTVVSSVCLQWRYQSVAPNHWYDEEGQERNSSEAPDEDNNDVIKAIKAWAIDEQLFNSIELNSFHFNSNNLYCLYCMLKVFIQIRSQKTFCGHNIMQVSKPSPSCQIRSFPRESKGFPKLHRLGVR